MKNKLVTMFVSLSMVVGVTLSRPANATVGIVTGQPVVAISGLVIALGGVGLMAHARAYPENSFLNSIVGLYSGIIGLVVLSELESVVNFKPLSQLTKVKKGITEKQNRIYENSIPELNAVLENVQIEIAANPQMSETEASQLWSEALTQFDSEVYSVLKLVMAN